MRAPPALLLPLLALALAHAARALSFSSEELLPPPPHKPDTKTVYERGNSLVPYNSKKSYHMEKGQCDAVVERHNLPCDRPERLWVEVQYDIKPPAITISDKLDHVVIRRKHPCGPRVEVYVKGGCLHKN